VFTWATMFVSASNSSLMEHVNELNQKTQATVVRVLEWHCPPLASTFKVYDAQAMIGKLRTNYGRAGEIYSQFLGANAERVASNVLQVEQQACESANLAGAERYLGGAVATIMLGAYYANELGLTRFDLPAMKQFFRRVLDEARQFRQDETIDLNQDTTLVLLVTDYLNAHRGKVLYTENVSTRRGRPIAGVIDLLNPEEVVVSHTKWAARYARSTDILWIDRLSFAEYLTKQRQQSFAEVMKRLKLRFNAKTITASISKSTGKSSSMGRLIEIDTTGGPLQGCFDYK
jgi:hypothetical protein